MVQKKLGDHETLSAPPHIFQKQKSCPQLLITENPSIQHLLETGVIRKDQLNLNTDENNLEKFGIEATRDRKTSWF